MPRNLARRLSSWRKTPLFSSTSASLFSAQLTCPAPKLSEVILKLVGNNIRLGCLWQDLLEESFQLAKLDQALPQNKDTIFKIGLELFTREGPPLVREGGDVAWYAFCVYV